MRDQATAAISRKVLPAHRALLAFLQDEYIPQAQTSIAAGDLPDGAAYYRAQIAKYTTRDMSAEDVHAIGLAEVANIGGEMSAAMEDTRFAGDLPAFLRFLRTDPQFYAKRPEDLLNRAAQIARAFDGKAAAYFGRLPKQGFTISPVPPDVAPFFTSGRGGPGYFLVNTHDLASRPLYSLPALALHESAPGHAFQMVLAAENEALPPFRRQASIAAYSEGWALYCERLGDEMGIYESPYERFGMLSYQMWRAARLVVDTGIHAFGWTREKAQSYLRATTALSEHEIVTEVDRYIAWPGQALSYYVGAMCFSSGRQRAELALGSRFDIRAFHDVLLALGSVTLDVVEMAVDNFVAGKADASPEN